MTIARRLFSIVLIVVPAGCTAILGIDKDYEEDPDAGASTGIGGSAGTNGTQGGASVNTTSTGGAPGTSGTGGSSGSSSDGGAVGTGGVPVDASGGAAGAPPDGGSNCGPGTKACGVCVSVTDPDYGCAASSCAPCEPHGTASCTGGTCAVTACDSGYHQVGNQCLANGMENCSNGADDDGDNRVDCLDIDCASSTACANKCIDAKQVGCDAILTGQGTMAAGSTQRIASYSCTTSTYGGSEYAYRFTGSANQDVFVEIYGLSGNLGIFEIDGTTGAQCAAASACALYGDASTASSPEALGFTVQQGRDYYLVVDGAATQTYSMSVQCSTAGGCRPTKAIGVGQSISATNNPASGASNITNNNGFYSCYSLQETGPEAAWMFTPTVTGSYQVRLSGLTSDCDLFVLSSNNCNGTCLTTIPASRSTNMLRQDETVTFSGIANTTYYIVVEGWSGNTCSFTLSMTQL